MDHWVVQKSDQLCMYKWEMEKLNISKKDKAGSWLWCRSLVTSLQTQTWVAEEQVNQASGKVQPWEYTTSV